jgi:putative transposase
VWCPKYRRKVISEPISIRLIEIVKQVCDERSATLVEIETMPDHVHLLVECDPQFGIHRLVKQIKGRSSRLLRQEFPEINRKLPTLWTNSYFCASVGGAPLEVIKQYVTNQRNV